MAINLIIGLLLFLIPYFFSSYNNVEITSFTAIIIAQAPKWQNTTVKRTSLMLLSGLIVYSLV